MAHRGVRVSNGVWKCLWRLAVRVYLHVLGANRSPFGSREFHSAEQDCARLTPAIVLVLSFLIELGSREVQFPAPALGRAAIDAERMPLPQKPAPIDVALERTHWQLEPRVLLALGIGLMPAPALGPALGLHLRTPWSLTLLLRGAYWPDTRTVVKATSVGADFQVFTGGLGVCLPLLTTSATWFATCWGPALILRRAESFGLAERLMTGRVHRGHMETAAARDRGSIGAASAYLAPCRQKVRGTADRLLRFRPVQGQTECWPRARTDLPRGEIFADSRPIARET